MIGPILRVESAPPHHEARSLGVYLGVLQMYDTDNAETFRKMIEGKLPLAPGLVTFRSGMTPQEAQDHLEKFELFPKGKFKDTAEAVEFYRTRRGIGK